MLLESYISSSSTIGGSDPSNINEMAQVYIALISVLNCQLPQIGKMFVYRVADRVLRRLKRTRETSLGVNVSDDEEESNLLAPECTSLITLLCGLANYFIVDPSVILQLLTMLLPSDSTKFLNLLADANQNNTKKDQAMVQTQLQLFELSIIILKCTGFLLSQEIPAVYQELLQQYRTILQELSTVETTGRNGQDVSLTRMKLESLFDIVRLNYEGFPMPCNLDSAEPTVDEDGREIVSLNLIDADDQFQHDLDLSDPNEIRKGLDNNVDFFKFDPAWKANEAMWGLTRA